MRRTLPIVVASLFCAACLDFSECPACDAGTPAKCETMNLMRASLAPLPGITTCAALDAGLKNGGQTAAGTCGSSTGSWGVESAFSRPAAAPDDAGIYLCARLKASAIPNTSAAIAFHCARLRRSRHGRLRLRRADHDLYHRAVVGRRAVDQWTLPVAGDLVRVHRCDVLGGRLRRRQLRVRAGLGVADDFHRRLHVE